MTSNPSRVRDFGEQLGQFEIVVDQEYFVHLGVTLLILHAKLTSGSGYNKFYASEESRF